MGQLHDRQVKRDRKDWQAGRFGQVLQLHHVSLISLVPFGRTSLIMPSFDIMGDLTFAEPLNMLEGSE